MAINFIKKGSSEKIIPIYATTDYRVITVPKPDNVTANISYVYNLDIYYLIRFDSDYYLYKRNNSNLEYIGKIDMITSGLAYPGIIGYLDDKVYVYIAEDTSKGNWYLYEYNLNDNSTSLVNSGDDTSYIGNVVWSTNGYFLSGLFGDLFKFNMDNCNLVDLDTVATTNNMYNLHKNSIVLLDKSNKKDLYVADISNNTIVKKDKTLNNIIYGVNYYKNKIFMNNGIYILNDDLSLGEKLRRYTK